MRTKRKTKHKPINIRRLLDDSTSILAKAYTTKYTDYDMLTEPEKKRVIERAGRYAGEQAARRNPKTWQEVLPEKPRAQRREHHEVVLEKRKKEMTRQAKKLARTGQVDEAKKILEGMGK